jgi:UDP-N-acetylglucosamine pyrophosphorylase
MSTPCFSQYAEKMRAAGMSPAAIRAFQHSYDQLAAGATGLVPENSIEPITNLPRLEDAALVAPNPALLSQSAIVKLNGGLGTSMGLEKAKSLLVVKEGLTFLDLIVKQVLYLRREHRVPLRFLLMNSFSTSRDTLEFIRRYPELGRPETLELRQSQVPKVDAVTLRPASWPANPQLEWCPPGHGDLYPSLLGSGWLDRLLAAGVKFMFVSNADNLGATLDPRLLSYFANSRTPFLMEVAERTSADRKGGHLAQRRGKLLLRESAQCPEPDQPAFQDVSRHRFFNTNNLWIRLESLKAALEAQGGFIPLPLIRNSKTIDPRQKDSPAVFQLETAMGAAIECFPGAGAVVVPRSRFAPVKTTADLLALRSDAYVLGADFRVCLAVASGEPPSIDLDPQHYKLADQLEAKLAGGVPSLKECKSLSVRGPVLFRSDQIFKGAVTVANGAAEPQAVPPGVYQNREVHL